VQLAKRPVWILLYRAALTVLAGLAVAIPSGVDRRPAAIGTRLGHLARIIHEAA
jgi:hypothetical protein